MIEERLPRGKEQRKSPCATIKKTNLIQFKSKPIVILSKAKK